MKKLFTLFAAMVTVVALNAQKEADLQLVGFYETLQSTTPITELTIGMNDNLKPYITYQNNGPSSLTSSDTMYFYAVVNNTPVAIFAAALGDPKLNLDEEYVLVMNAQYDPATILTKEYMNENNLTGTFEVCAMIMGGNSIVDNTPGNNLICLTVHRGTTGISEVAEGEVNVYPNPATTVINIDNAEGAQISVFDLSGRMVSSVNSASSYHTIDASNLAEVMYIVRIANGNNVITKKVSVVR